jgi:energy-coupling factor transporter ATP-binding protein EcfA2
MTFDLNEPTKIYQNINDVLTRIISSIASATTDDALNNAQNDTREQLESLQVLLRQQLAELQKNAEWDTFTIAFYGETGAGKSTLIETLRILLKEPSKLENQEKFRKLKNAYQLNLATIQQVNNDIQIVNKSLEELDQKFTLISDDYIQQYNKLLQHIEQNTIAFSTKIHEFKNELQLKVQANSDILGVIEKMEEQVVELKKRATLWQKLMYFFKKMPEEEALEKVKEQLSQKVAAYELALEALKAQKAEAEEDMRPLSAQKSELEINHSQTQHLHKIEQKKLEQQRQTLLLKVELLQVQVESQLEEFTQHADGEIIGDGQADFTRETQKYHFILKNNRFDILDVPGIEGKEGLVLQQIENAVQKAHAVFYVTNKPTPPQTGDEGRKGTLEKIKDHLGSQTEVWSIFNKKVTNPKHTFNNRGLILEDEQASLLSLDAKMQEHLGKHYQQVFSLSALPAFLASTDCLVPNSQNDKRRSKFLKDFTEAELLELSCMQAFLDILDQKLLPDSQNKIRRANLNKAKEAVDDTTNGLSKVEKAYRDLADNISGTRDSSKNQLFSSFNIMKTRLNTESEHFISKFVQSTRKKVYERIEDDINKDTFKHVLESCIKDGLDDISQIIPEMICIELKRFQDDASDILQRFEEHTLDLTKASETISKAKFDQHFDIKIDIENGVNKLGLLGALVGAALIPFTGGASLWVAGGAAFTVLISFGKAIASFFSSSYKISQQKESTNENLNKVKKSLQAKFRSSLDTALPEMKKTIDKLEQALDAPVITMQKTSKLLQNSNQKLKILSTQIKVSGDL